MSQCAGPDCDHSSHQKEKKSQVIVDDIGLNFENGPMPGAVFKASELTEEQKKSGDFRPLNRHERRAMRAQGRKKKGV